MLSSSSSTLRSSISPLTTRVKVVQYNILSERLANKNFYVKATDEEVNAKLRWSKIVAQLQAAMADNAIICLQEVGRNWLGKLTLLAEQKGYRLYHDNYGNYFSDYMGNAVLVPSCYKLAAEPRYQKVGDLVPREPVVKPTTVSVMTGSSSSSTTATAAVVATTANTEAPAKVTETVVDYNARILPDSSRQIISPFRDNWWPLRLAVLPFRLISQITSWLTRSVIMAPVTIPKYMILRLLQSTGHVVVPFEELRKVGSVSRAQTSLISHVMARSVTSQLASNQLAKPVTTAGSCGGSCTTTTTTTSTTTSTTDKPKRNEDEDPWGVAGSRYNTSISVKLLDVETGSKFWIHTYHLPCLFTCPPLMTIHACLFLQHVQSLSASDPYIICMDSNFTPDKAQYQLYTTGSITENECSEAKSALPPARDRFRCKVAPVVSSHVAITGTEPSVTCSTFTKWDKNEEPGSFQGCIDYIFCNANSCPELKVVSVEPVAELTAEQFLPSLIHPSDHLSLAACFEISSQQSATTTASSTPTTRLDSSIMDSSVIDSSVIDSSVIESSVMTTSTVDGVLVH